MLMTIQLDDDLVENLRIIADLKKVSLEDLIAAYVESAAVSEIVMSSLLDHSAAPQA